MHYIEKINNVSKILQCIHKKNIKDRNISLISDQRNGDLRLLKEMEICVCRFVEIDLVNKYVRINKDLILF